MVRGTGGDEQTGIIRIDFPGFSGEEKLEPITWDEFFQKFDESNLALVYAETTRGQKSNFNNLISRESVDVDTGERVAPPRRRRKQAERGTAKRAATPRGASAKVAGEKKSSPRRATRSGTAARGERRAPRDASARKTAGRSTRGAKKGPTKRGSNRGGKSRSR